MVSTCAHLRHLDGDLGAALKSCDADFDWERPPFVLEAWANYIMNQSIHQQTNRIYDIKYNIGVISNEFFKIKHPQNIVVVNHELILDDLRDGYSCL